MLRAGSLVALAASVGAKAIAHSENGGVVHALQTTADLAEADDPAPGPDTDVPVVSTVAPTFQLEGWCRDWREGSTNGTGILKSYFPTGQTMES